VHLALYRIQLIDIFILKMEKCKYYSGMISLIYVNYLKLLK